MKIVLDASAAIRVILDHDSDMLSILLKTPFVLAPDLYIAELGNVFVNYHRIKKLNFDLCMEHFTNGVNLITQWIDHRYLQAETFELCKPNVISYYDALYLNIAVTQNAKLLTADKKLAKIAKQFNCMYETHSSP